MVRWPISKFFNVKDTHASKPPLSEVPSIYHRDLERHY
jgi:hypothetical protein